MSIVIFEGSNKVGKSTLIDALADECDREGIKCCIFNKRHAKNSEKKVTPEEMFEIACRDFSEMLKHSRNKLVIVDRFHITEFVYGLIYRGYYNFDMLEVIDKLLKAVDAKLIMVTSYYEHIEDPFEKWKLNKIQEDMLKFKTNMDELEVRLTNVEKRTLRFEVGEILNFIKEGN